MFFDGQEKGPGTQVEETTILPPKKPRSNEGIPEIPETLSRSTAP